LKQILFIIIAIFAINDSRVFGQGKPYEGPDDPAGDIAAKRIGIMTGNRIILPVQNSTELGNLLGGSPARWPNDENSMRMHDNIALLIGAKVFLENDTIPVTDPNEIATRQDLDTLFFVQTKYRAGFIPPTTETDPTGTIEWGFYPVFGYFNEVSEYPAMSNRPDSWPPGGWPARGDETKWPGEWNGRFGRGVVYADLEIYFVANDAHDQEYLGKDDRVKYYPRPGIKIGDKNPGVTIQKGFINRDNYKHAFTQLPNPELREGLFRFVGPKVLNQIAEMDADIKYRFRHLY
jgi:hypothetical protein